MEEKESDFSHDHNLLDLHAGNEEPAILEEIEIEELFIDGICGVY